MPGENIYKMGVHNTSPLKEKEIFYKKFSFTNVLKYSAELCHP